MSAELPVSRPSEQGVDADGVLAFIDAVEGTGTVDLHSLMLLRHGHLVASCWWAPYTPDRLQLVYSLSKMFTATAVGLAVSEGLLSLDAPVLDYFPELAGKVDDARTQRMLVRHLLAMASGHTSDNFEAAEAVDAEDVARGFLQLVPDGEPGVVFTYAQPCTYTLSALITRVSGQGLVDYLRPRLLDPLSIGEVAWTTHRSGQELGFSGLHATTDAVARLGQLYLQRGQWHGRQLLPAEWVDEASRPHVENAGTGHNVDWQQGYGFQLWKSRHGYRGDGAYGQFCLVLPEHDAVVVLTSETHGMQAVLDLAWEHLLPAFDGPGDVASDDRLTAALAGRSLPAVSSEAAGSPDLRGFQASTSGVLGEVSLRRDGDDWWLGLADGPDVPDPLRLEARVGLDGWQVTEAAVPVASSGGWTSPSTLVVDVVFVETPHRIRLTCHLGSGRVDTEWRTEPFVRTLRGLAAPRPAK